MGANYHRDRAGHPYSRYLLGEQDLQLMSERKQNSIANVEEDKSPGQLTVGFTGRPPFSKASEDRPRTSEMDNSEEASQCLLLLQKRLSAKKHQIQEKEVEIESHQKEVDTMERMCNDYKAKIADLEATSPYRLPPYERQLISDYNKKSEEIQCEIAKRMQVVNRLMVSSREIEEHCESLGDVIEGIEKELGSHEETPTMSTQDSDEDHPMMRKLECCKWYWGDLTKKMSRNIILYSPLGSFLVRNSSSTPGEYVLAFKVRDMTMMKIKHVGDKYGLSVGCLKFSSVPELVAYYRAHSLAEVDPVIDLMLSTPIEKYTLQDSSDNSSDEDDFDDGGDGEILRDVSDQECERISALTKSGKWNYCDPDKHYVTPVRIVNYIHHLSPKWELLGYKLAVETTVRNLRESPINNDSKCIQVVEAWLESTHDVSWKRFLTVLKEMNMMRTVNYIIEQEKLNIRLCKTAKVIHQVK